MVVRWSPECSLGNLDERPLGLSMRPISINAYMLLSFFQLIREEVFDPLEKLLFRVLEGLLQSFYHLLDELVLSTGEFLPCLSKDHYYIMEYGRASSPE